MRNTNDGNPAARAQQEEADRLAEERRAQREAEAERRRQEEEAERKRLEEEERKREEERQRLARLEELYERRKAWEKSDLTAEIDAVELGPQDNVFQELPKELYAAFSVLSGFARQ